MLTGRFPDSVLTYPQFVKSQRSKNVLLPEGQILNMKFPHYVAIVISTPSFAS